jgi:hypothetical protein
MDSLGLHNTEPIPFNKKWKIGSQKGSLGLRNTEPTPFNNKYKSGWLLGIHHLQ